VNGLPARLSISSCLGFNLDWGDEANGGIAGVSKGHCRMFLTNPAFREMYGNAAPVLVWLDLSSREQVNELQAGHATRDRAVGFLASVRHNIKSQSCSAHRASQRVRARKRQSADGPMR
jgi:hypothetical protein